MKVLNSRAFYLNKRKTVEIEKSREDLREVLAALVGNGVPVRVVPVVQPELRHRVPEVPRRRVDDRGLQRPDDEGDAPDGCAHVRPPQEELRDQPVVRPGELADHEPVRYRRRGQSAGAARERRRLPARVYSNKSQKNTLGFSGFRPNLASQSFHSRFIQIQLQKPLIKKE